MTRPDEPAETTVPEIVTTCPGVSVVPPMKTVPAPDSNSVNVDDPRVMTAPDAGAAVVDAALGNGSVDFCPEEPLALMTIPLLPIEMDVPSIFVVWPCVRVWPEIMTALGLDGSAEMIWPPIVTALLELDPAEGKGSVDVPDAPAMTSPVEPTETVLPSMTVCWPAVSVEPPITIPDPEGAADMVCDPTIIGPEFC